MRKFRLFALLVVGAALGGCAIGNKYDYRAATPAVSVKSDKQVVVAVVDRRTYVLSGNKGSNFIGLQRGGYGNPFDVTTSSGQPLAADFKDILVRALKNSGVDASPSKSSYRLAPETAVTTLASENAERSMIFVIREWKTDTYINAALIYDVTLNVYDGNIRLASRRLQGRDRLGAVALPSQVGPLAAAAAKAKMEVLLNDPSINSALGSK